jgi:plasmid maintenance system antidote protein VapI
MKDDRLQHTIDLLKRCGEAKGMTITEEEMAGKIGMPLGQLQAYVDGEQVTPAEMTGRLMTAYDELYKEIQQRNRNVRMRSTMEAIRYQGAKQGNEITDGEMGGELGMTGEELAVYLQDPGITQEEFSALADRLRAAYPELFKHVRSVTHTTQHEVKMPLAVELDWEDMGDE